MFSVVVKFDVNYLSRPCQGWIIYDIGPNGKSPILTARKKIQKFAKLEQALAWAADHRPGYVLHLDYDLDGVSYEGDIFPTTKNKHADLPENLRKAIEKRKAGRLVSAK
jgi:hypothetical protein